MHIVHVSKLRLRRSLALAAMALTTIATAFGVFAEASVAAVPKITTNHSSDAGNYGGSLPNAMVENFANVVYSMDQTDTQTTTQNQLVQLTYSPGNMNLNERFWLLGALDQFAQNQQSWHGNWFLWNVVTVSDPANHASIQLTIS